MQAWNEENPHLFKEELDELNGKYRSNIRYFIYKNIILRNLYGVDIMVEATEIAKLRLFLKMVAVVDVVFSATPTSASTPCLISTSTSAVAIRSLAMPPTMSWRRIW